MTIGYSREFADEGELDVIEGVQRVEDVDMLHMIEAIAHERAKNIELKRERDRLERRISEEEARLAHV